ncbi:hypothetical protein CC2G_013245 [Coprinopsis cinerea AmutBmut pab1-1]|nr:hypothetical protein CC2G_013245 [Coprinopsis cinerea AmutBmut pab1-1]
MSAAQTLSFETNHILDPATRDVYRRRIRSERGEEDIVQHSTALKAARNRRLDRRRPCQALDALSSISAPQRSSSICLGSRLSQARVCQEVFAWTDKGIVEFIRLSRTTFSFPQEVTDSFTSREASRSSKDYTWLRRSGVLRELLGGGSEKKLSSRSQSVDTALEDDRSNSKAFLASSRTPIQQYLNLDKTTLGLEI